MWQLFQKVQDKNVTEFTVLMQKGMTDKGKEEGVKDDSLLSFSRPFLLVCVY
jgi:hypothetical protein